MALAPFVPASGRAGVVAFYAIDLLKNFFYGKAITKA